MTRKEFIDRLIAIYRLKYKPSDLEVDEFRLLLETMPDNQTITTPFQSPIIVNPSDSNPRNPYTYPWWNDIVYSTSNNANSSSTFTDFNKRDNIIPTSENKEETK